MSDFEGFPGKFIFENIGNKSAKDYHLEYLCSTSTYHIWIIIYIYA